MQNQASQDITLKDRKLQNIYKMASHLDNNSAKEAEGLLHDTSLTINKLNVVCGESRGSCNDKNYTYAEEKEEHDRFLTKEASDSCSSEDNCKSKLQRDKICTVNKSLLAFRVTHFLWFGAGSLPTIFLGILLKQQGLTIVELSSIFSMIFFVYLLACFITGIITDKIGNAKPVLLFLMIVDSALLVCISLTPNVNSVSCTQLEENLTYSKFTNFNSCYINCFLNNEDHFQTEENYSMHSILQNASFTEELETDNGDFPSEIYCNVSNMKLKNISLEFYTNYCCDACRNGTKVECVTVRNGYLVAAYAVLILAFYALWSTTYRFFDFTAVNIAAKHDSQFGKERAFAMCGTIIILVITAFVFTIDKSSDSKIHFASAMWIAAGIIFFALFTLLATNIPILPPGKNLVKKAFILAKDVDILVFILLVFVAGNAFSFHFVFHLVLLESINAPKLVIGLHSVAIYLYGLPVLFTFPWWLNKFGTEKLLVLGLLFYAVNNTAYSYIDNAWWCLVIDISIAFSLHLLWSAAVVHCRNKAPVGFAATLNAMTGAMHFGVGRSSGVFIGGMIMNYIGLRKAYRVMAAVCFLSAVLYSIFIYGRRKRPAVNITVISGNETSNTERHKNADI